MPGDLPVALTMGGTAFMLAVIWGDPFITMLKRLGMGKQIRESLSHHQAKTGTPTFGGLMILIPAILLTLALNVASLLNPDFVATGRSILLPLSVLAGFAVLGAIDDWEGVRGLREKGEGLSPGVKFAAQIVLATGVALVMSLGNVQYANAVTIPLLSVTVPVSPVLWIPVAVFFIVGMSNAVNITDGVDGLAGIIVASAFAAYAVIAYLQRQIYLVQFCFIIVGAIFAFLWYNALPARLIMGDTGSLALGATLATVALMTGQWLLLPVIAFVPVVETLSVILQVLYARLTGGRRLFRLAPLHHHFELSGWSETQVVQRFWLIGLLAVMIGIAFALV